MLKTIQELSAEPADSFASFDDFEEEAIVRLAIDLPDYFGSVAHLFTYTSFLKPEVRYIMAHLLDWWKEHQVVPPRDQVRSRVLDRITVEEGGTRVRAIIDKPLDPREAPLLKEVLHEWARRRAYSELYSEETVAAYKRGDYDRLEDIVHGASRIVQTAARGFWFYEQFEELFEPDTTIHLPTGFKQLDRHLNNGGPSAGEVVCWLAATGVGKCHTLQTKIYERKLSRIYELEMEDGKVLRLVGARRLRTARGDVRVCDLAENDDILELPTVGDEPDLRLSTL